MQPATPTAPPAADAPAGSGTRRRVVPAPRTRAAPASRTAGAPPRSCAGGTGAGAEPGDGAADVVPAPPGTASAARGRLVVGALVVGPPTAVLLAVLSAGALDLSAPAATLLAGTEVGITALLMRASAVLLLAAAALGVHGAVLRRGVHPLAASGAVVLGAAPVGGLALVEPLPTALLAGAVALVGAVRDARRRGARTGLLVVAALLVVAPASAGWSVVVARGSSLADPLAGAASTAGRAALAGGAGIALPLLVLAAVLTRGRARLLLSLLAGAAGLVGGLVGG